MDRIWSRIQHYYHQFGTSCRYTVIKLSMFCNIKSPKSEFPLLKGKAAEVRQLGPALLAATRDFLEPTGDPLHLAAIGGLEASVRMEDILDEHDPYVDWKLPPAAAHEYLEATLRFLTLFNFLAKSYQDEPVNLKMFNITIKAWTCFFSILHVSNMFLK